MRLRKHRVARDHHVEQGRIDDVCDWGGRGRCVVLEAKKNDMESVHHNYQIDDHQGGDRLGVVPVNV